MKRQTGGMLVGVGSLLWALTVGAADNRTWVALPSSARTADTHVEQIDSTRTVITVNLAGFWRQTESIQGTSYDRIELDGWGVAQDVGLPAVPVQCHMIEIPPGHAPAVRIGALEEASVSRLSIPPAQPPPPDVYPEPPPPAFELDAGVYEADAFYPRDNILHQTVVDIRDKRYLVLHVTPIRWNPRSGEAKVATHLEVVAAHTPSDDPSDATELPADVTGALKRYMVLMDDQFAVNGKLNELVDWKRRKGYNVTVVRTSQINANGAPSNTEIVAYMRALPATNYPHYLLILGDHTAANGVAGKYFNTSSTDYYGYTDLDIACRTGTDFVPDLYCGRLFATNNAQASNMLIKVLAMDRSPPASAMYQKVCVAGQIQDSDDHNNRADRLFCETADLVASYFEQDAGGVDYTCQRAIVNPDGMTAEGYWNESSILWNPEDQIGTRVYNHFTGVTTARGRIVTNINTGIALLQHRDHGYVDGAGWADPSFYYTHVHGLTNGVNRPAVFSINCNSGMYNMYAYDNPYYSFVRAWLNHNNGGTYAFFGPVDTSYSWLNDWLTHGFYTAFLSNYISFQNTCTTPTWSKQLPAPNGAYGAVGTAWRLGEILNFGKMYMYEKFYPDETTFRLFHVFGDPESELRLLTPATLSVSHPSLTLPGASTVTVTLAESGCTVCLYASDGSIHLVETNAGTSVSFDIDAAWGLRLYVTVTKRARRPYEGTVTVGDLEDFWFRATALTNNVLLRWEDPVSCGMGSRMVHIRYDTSDYPAETNNGLFVYQGTNFLYNHTGLTPGQPHYYTLWASHDGTNFVNPP